MKPFTILLILLCIFYPFANSIDKESHKFNEKLPTVLIVSLIRNKAHTLPYFFSYLENLEYPKDRLALWFRSDHNEDNSIELTHIWLNRTAHYYKEVDFKYDEYPKMHRNETSRTDWPNERFSHLIQLKETALEKANKMWADFVFIIDADVFLTDPRALNHLVSLKLPIVAPMLVSEGLYSNFWGGMTEKYYYERTEEYQEIYNFKKLGQFAVPMVHSAVLIDQNYEINGRLTFDRQKLIKEQIAFGIDQLYRGPIDDIIIFALSAKSFGIPMYVSNELFYGFILQPMDDMQKDLQQLINIKLAIINEFDAAIHVNDEFKKFIFYPEKHQISLDHIYMINLDRRSERRHKMELSFKELGLNVEHFPAVDGRELNPDVIREMNIEFLSGYEDPYHHRQMTMGEIGCFLSHYKIWEKIVERGQKEVLVIEDDIRFEPYFNDRAIYVLEQARRIGGWDLIYFGRKRLEEEDEPWVGGANNLVHVGYSYWTLGYVLSLQGAKKLLNAQPLKKLVPVDEYLPIMFDRHPNNTWRSAFYPRNVVAFSAAPLIMFPTHYTGDNGYISDTEDSPKLTPPGNEKGNAQLKSDKNKKSNEHFDVLLDDSNLNSKHSLLSNHLSDSITKHDSNEL